MLADDVDYVIGVDTHRDEHVLAVVSAPAGAVVAGAAAPTNARGDCQLLRVAERYASGRRVWAIEGSGSYGAGLARFLADRGEAVLEVSRTPRTSGGCAAKTTRWTPRGRRGRSWPARRSHGHARVSGGRHCGCCSSLVAAPSTSDARRSPSSAP